MSYLGVFIPGISCWEADLDGGGSCGESGAGVQAGKAALPHALW